MPFFFTTAEILLDFFASNLRLQLICINVMYSFYFMPKYLLLFKKESPYGVCFYCEFILALKIVRLRAHMARSCLLDWHPYFRPFLILAWTPRGWLLKNSGMPSRAIIASKEVWCIAIFTRIMEVIR